jgi:hypothetical protein
MSNQLGVVANTKYGVTVALSLLLTPRLVCVRIRLLFRVSVTFGRST